MHLPPRIFDDTLHDEFPTVNFPPDVVERKLLGLKTFSSPGPDGLHPLVLKSCASILKVPLSLIYDKSMATGRLPSDWRLTNITPIFKSGKKNEPSNYRPINLCSIPCKIMESIIKDEMIQHLTMNELVDPSQHGFLPGKSCTTNLLTYLDEVTSALDNGVPYDVIMIDFLPSFRSRSF